MKKILWWIGAISIMCLPLTLVLCLWCIFRPGHSERFQSFMKTLIEEDMKQLKRKGN